jgi:hypothetical protein
MSVTTNAVYSKPGATFASGAEAYANKNSLYGTELTNSVEACYNNMLSQGILLEPIGLQWDQTTETLTVVKVVSSVEAYQAAVTFDSQLCVTKSQEAGWTFNPIV